MNFPLFYKLWEHLALLSCIFANTANAVCILFGNSEYEYDYSYYGGYDYEPEQESTILEEPDVDFVIAA